jgi:hypothetical protein
MGKVFKNRHVTSGIGDAGDKGLYRYKTVETKNRKREVNTFADGTKERNVYKRSNDGKYEVLVRHNGKKVKSPFTMESPFTKKKKACWKGWVKRGMKKKGDRMVNNCVKKGRKRK